MTDITRTNIKEFWNTLAEADLGTAVQPVAQDMAEFFNGLLKDDGVILWGERWFCTDTLTLDNRAAAYIRGFQMETGYGGDDGLNICLCLDLHSVTMTEDIALEFQAWMICQAAYKGDMFNWIYRYQEIVKERDAKRKGKRRNRKSA